MNRKIVMCLLGFGAVGSLAVVWPTQSAPMTATVEACSVGAVAEMPPPGTAGRDLPATAATFFVPVVKLTPLTTTEQYQGYYRQVEATLPHLSGNDVGKMRYFCPADTNRDDRVDEQDLGFFLHAWSQGDSAIGRLADVNGDGLLDEQDYSAFMDAYFGGTCSPEEQKVYRSTIC